MIFVKLIITQKQNTINNFRVSFLRIPAAVSCPDMTLDFALTTAYHVFSCKLCYTYIVTSLRVILRNLFVVVGYSVLFQIPIGIHPSYLYSVT